MCARFVPPHRKKHLLKLQRLHQGPRTVKEYFKDLETTLTKFNMPNIDESDNSICEWFKERNSRCCGSIRVFFFKEVASPSHQGGITNFKENNFQNTLMMISTNLLGRMQTTF